MLCLDRLGGLVPDETSALESYDIFPAHSPHVPPVVCWWCALGPIRNPILLRLMAIESISAAESRKPPETPPCSSK